jgi:hypothetical protein
MVTFAAARGGLDMREVLGRTPSLQDKGFAFAAGFPGFRG